MELYPLCLNWLSCHRAYVWLNVSIPDDSASVYRIPIGDMPILHRRLSREHVTTYVFRYIQLLTSRQVALEHNIPFHENALLQSYPSPWEQ